MVFQLQLRNRLRLQSLIAGVALALSVCGASADEGTAAQYLGEAKQFFNDGHFFRAARYAFAASEQDPSLKAEAYAWITVSLAEAGMYNSSSYFFIRTLQSDNKGAIRRVLPQTPKLLIRLGPDLIRSYLIRHTNYDDYDPAARSAYLYALSKDAMFNGAPDRAVGYLNAMRPDSPLWPYGLEMRGAAQAILGRNDAAIADFKSCQERAHDLYKGLGSGSHYREKVVREAQDLQARCYAGEARTLYQMNRFEDADRVYDRIPKASLVWPEILFEQAWNSFAKGEYNRTLGKLVSYKSPALTFVLNSEIDVLRAQAYLALCLYPDANDVINEFNTKYVPVGEQVKKFVEANQHNLPIFYEAGKRALRGTIYTNEGLYKMANQFVRGPYFQNLVAAEEDSGRERAAISDFAANQPGVEKRNGGFPGFLTEVLNWRIKMIQDLGGMFVKNSFLDYHSAVIADFEKMAFIKLEMLKRAKEQLERTKPTLASGEERTRGNVIPNRRDNQMFWTFNGEFWNDELGDYVFGLESECKENGV